MGIVGPSGVEYVYRTIRVDTTVNPKKPACFVCSWHRRKMLFDIAKEYDCKKLALGHHRDDAVESLLMSMMFNGTICSMPARLEMFKNTFTLIRPLIYLSNDETLRYAEGNVLIPAFFHRPVMEAPLRSE